MDNSTRLQYLKAMGVDVWVSRGVYDQHSSIEGDESTEQAESQLKLESESWSVLQKQVVECQLCALCNTRTQTVFGTGNQNAEWMFIGEAPGKNEDLEGKPFVGPAGLLLTEMIRAIGLQRDAVYIANIVKCRPPNNRDPKVEEIKACNDYLQQQIALIKPKIILAVGRVAAQALLETSQPLSKLRGVVHQLDGIPLVVVYHPAYLLRSLSEKGRAWQDLKLAMRQMRKNNNNEHMEVIRSS